MFTIIQTQTVARCASHRLHQDHSRSTVHTLTSARDNSPTRIRAVGAQITNNKGNYSSISTPHITKSGAPYAASTQGTRWYRVRGISTWHRARSESCALPKWHGPDRGSLRRQSDEMSDPLHSGPTRHVVGGPTSLRRQQRRRGGLVRESDT